uniref:tight junction protein ZO-2-like isoform X2 n=1 Tax=Myxine glutinosa TaxID=7769 RepID=UPI00358DE1D4
MVHDYGFGIAISGGKKKPGLPNSYFPIIVDDVIKGGPADGHLRIDDQVLMVNGKFKDQLDYSTAVKELRSSEKTAKVTVRRRHLVKMSTAGKSEMNDLSENSPEVNSIPTSMGQGTGPLEHMISPALEATEVVMDREGTKVTALAPSTELPADNGEDRDIAVEMSDGAEVESLADDDQNAALMDPSLEDEKQDDVVKVILTKKSLSEGFGLRLGSQLYIKDVSSHGLAAQNGNLHEGDIVLKINGTVTENMSLMDARRLIERSFGKLQLTIHREKSRILTNLPELQDSTQTSDMSDVDDVTEVPSMTSEAPSLQSSPSPSRRQFGSKKCLNTSRGSSKCNRTSMRDHKSEVVCAMPPIDLAALHHNNDRKSCVFTTPRTNSQMRPKGESKFKVITFCKQDSVGLQLVGGNAVGIFVAGVQTGSPAAAQGLQEGDQLLKVNDVDFMHTIREDAVFFLLHLPKGQLITLHAQQKWDVYRSVMDCNIRDSFYIRTHFEYKAETAQSLEFGSGEVFRVVDTLHSGELGSWLVLRLGEGQTELERGVIPSRNRAEQLVQLQSDQQLTGPSRSGSWKFRSLRSVKKSETKQRSDASPRPVHSHLPAYETVVLGKAGFPRPVVIFGPLSDVGCERLAREEPNEFEIPKGEPKDAGTKPRMNGLIRLLTIKEIINRNRHAVLDVTPGAAARLHRSRWHPIVIFLQPDSRSGLRAMRRRLCPASDKSSQRLYDQALKLQRNYSFLFTATIKLNFLNDGWYGQLKATIREQQGQLVWVSAVKAEELGEKPCGPEDLLSFLSAQDSEYSLCFAKGQQSISECEEEEADIMQCVCHLSHSEDCLSQRGPCLRSATLPVTGKPKRLSLQPMFSHEPNGCHGMHHTLNLCHCCQREGECWLTEASSQTASPHQYFHHLDGRMSDLVIQGGKSRQIDPAMTIIKKTDTCGMANAFGAHHCCSHPTTRHHRGPIHNPSAECSCLGLSTTMNCNQKEGSPTFQHNVGVYKANGCRSCTSTASRTADKTTASPTTNRVCQSGRQVVNNFRQPFCSESLLSSISPGQSILQQKAGTSVLRSKSTQGMQPAQLSAYQLTKRSCCQFPMDSMTMSGTCSSKSLKGACKRCVDMKPWPLLNGMTRLEVGTNKVCTTPPSPSPPVNCDGHLQNGNIACCVDKSNTIYSTSSQKQFGNALQPGVAAHSRNFAGRNTRLPVECCHSTHVQHCKAFQHGDAENVMDYIANPFGKGSSCSALSSIHKARGNQGIAGAGLSPFATCSCYLGFCSSTQDFECSPESPTKYETNNVPAVLQLPISTYSKHSEIGSKCSITTASHQSDTSIKTTQGLTRRFSEPGNMESKRAFSEGLEAASDPALLSTVHHAEEISHPNSAASSSPVPQNIQQETFIKEPQNCSAKPDLLQGPILPQRTAESAELKKHPEADNQDLNIPCTQATHSEPALENDSSLQCLDTAKLACDMEDDASAPWRLNAVV